jgi:hypothetical protein
MSNLSNTLLESELHNTVFENENDLTGAVLLEAGSRAAEQFDINLVNYVCENYSDFLGKDYKETHKNILTFAQSAKNQFLSETSALISSEISKYFPRDLTSSVRTDDYL